MFSIFGVKKQICWGSQAPVFLGVRDKCCGAVRLCLGAGRRWTPHQWCIALLITALVTIYPHRFFKVHTYHHYLLFLRPQQLQPRRQAVVWRPAVLLQQAGQTRHERHGRRHRQVQAQAVSADWRGEYSAGNILSAVDIIYFLEKYLLFKTQIYLFLI